MPKRLVIALFMTVSSLMLCRRISTLLMTMLGSMPWPGNAAKAAVLAWPFSQVLVMALLMTMSCLMPWPGIAL